MARVRNDAAVALDAMRLLNRANARLAEQARTIRTQRWRIDRLERQVKSLRAQLQEHRP